MWKSALIASLAVLAGSAAAHSAWAEAPSPSPPLRVVLLPEISALLAIDLGEKRSARLEGARALRGRIVEAVVTEPVLFAGCPIVKVGARAKLLVVDAVSAQSGGLPGFILLKLTEIEFGDGSSQKVDGGLYCVSGVDKSDQGRRLGILPRKGGEARLDNGARFEVALFGAGAGAPTECTADRKAAPAAEPPPDVPVILLSPSPCGEAS